MALGMGQGGAGIESLFAECKNMDTGMGQSDLQAVLPLCRRYKHPLTSTLHDHEPLPMLAPSNPAHFGKAFDPWNLCALAAPLRTTKHHVLSTQPSPVVPVQFELCYMCRRYTHPFTTPFDAGTGSPRPLGAEFLCTPQDCKIL